MSFEWLMRPKVRGKMLPAYAKAIQQREPRKVPLSPEEARAILNLRAPGELEALAQSAGSSFSKYFKEKNGEYIFQG
ncbi:MAG: hypothetical protein ACUVTD_01645 [Nitrososphaerales archaeon]